MIEEVIDPDIARAGALRRVAASASSPRSGAARSRCCATGRADLVCRVPAVTVLMRARLRHLRGRDPGACRRHEARCAARTCTRARSRRSFATIAGVDEFQTLITREGIRDEITLRDRDDSQTGGPSVVGRSWRTTLAPASYAQAHEGLNFRDRARRRRRAATVRAQGETDRRPARRAAGSRIVTETRVDLLGSDLTASRDDGLLGRLRRPQGAAAPRTCRSDRGSKRTRGARADAQLRSPASA